MVNSVIPTRTIASIQIAKLFDVSMSFARSKTMGYFTQVGNKNNFLNRCIALFVLKYSLFIYSMVWEFFNDYFVRPIIENTGYNAVNTVVYAVIFAAAVFGIYKLLVKLNIKIDKTFYIGIFPFILFGSLLRVVNDTGFYRTYFLVSPMIYILIFAATLIALLLSFGIARLFMKDYGKYYKPWSVIGIILSIYAIWLLFPVGLENPEAIGIALGLTAVWGVIIYAGYRYRSKIKWLVWMTKENSFLLGIHMFDASTTFTAIQFYATQGYFEQHVLSNVLIDVVGPAGQFLLKLIVVQMCIKANQYILL